MLPNELTVNGSSDEPAASHSGSLPSQAELDCVVTIATAAALVNTSLDGSANTSSTVATSNESGSSGSNGTSVTIPNTGRVESILDAKAALKTASSTAATAAAIANRSAIEEIVPCPAGPNDDSLLHREDTKKLSTAPNHQQAIVVGATSIAGPSTGTLSSQSHGLEEANVVALSNASLSLNEEGHNHVDDDDDPEAVTALEAHVVVDSAFSASNENGNDDTERARFRQEIRERLVAENTAVQKAEPVLPMVTVAAAATEAGMDELSPTAASIRQKRTRRRFALLLATVATIVSIAAGASVLGRYRQSPATPQETLASNNSTTAPSSSGNSSSPPPDDAIVWLPNGRQAFTTTAQLYQAVDDYDAALQANETAEGSLVATQYGHPIGTWDVSRLTDFSKAFCVNREQTLEADVRLSALRTMDIPNLSGWNVSRATTMHGMFAGATNWLADDDGLMDWDVGRVMDFSFMFGYAEAWTGDSIAYWNTSSATLMSSMFVKAYNFNADLSRWDVARVSNMAYMFFECQAYSGGDLTNWNTGQVRNMAYMFRSAKTFTGDISTWNTASVNTMETMFSGASSFNGDLSRWNVSLVTDMNSFFLGANAYQGGDLSSWDTSRVVDISFIFGHCGNFNGNVSTWNVSFVRTFEETFEYNLVFEQDLSQWDTSAASNMKNMFKDAYVFNSDLSLWQTAKVTAMTDMFQNARAFNSDISSWDVTNVRDTARMFRSADSFNQSLCAWQSKLPIDAVVTEMFDQSNCADTSDPSLSLAAVEDATLPPTWSGTFCALCEDSAGV